MRLASCMPSGKMGSDCWNPLVGRMLSMSLGSVERSKCCDGSMMVTVTVGIRWEVAAYVQYA